MKKISSALISVWHKEGLLPILEMLDALEVKLYSTGGTQAFIRDAGFEVTAVEEVTGYPSIFGGRVKTLHPSVMGGILFRRNNNDDLAEAGKYNIPPIDLVVVDLYPFRETVQEGKKDDEVIEKIDIGGISLIRAAAKNFNDVVIIPDRNAYQLLHQILEEGGETTLETRRSLAATAFDVSSDYDSAIYRYFASELEIPSLKVSSRNPNPLRYGENPHQKGIFYGNSEEMLIQLHGKAISYNNLLDIDAAVQLIAEFSEPTVAILKHNNACGLASRDSLEEAWDRALEADPLSAYGGVIIVNQPVGQALAEKINQIFFEVIVAPDFTIEALTILTTKKNRIILRLNEGIELSNPVRNVLNGYLVQDRDLSTEELWDMRTVTGRTPDERELEDLAFANKIVKHTRSNAIVLANGKQLIGSGTGQTSRIDAMKQAIEKARHFGLPIEGAVVASDAFFPFPDNVATAWEAGIRAVVQPGGSVKDQDSIDFCNEHDIAMVFTGIRHFKH
ncbi:MAG: bifunctional phosphoribosylaminoimidazolecarboxamide formyltransferase/IMP cyclohydrolase [Bacteroidales bacterium]